MNTKRAILSGILLWVLIFFEVSILLFGFKLAQGATAYYISHYILLVILVVISSLVYFKERKIKANFKQGVLLGICFILVGVVLDSIITIPLFLKMDYSFLISMEMLMSNILVIVVSGVVGLVKKK